MNIDNRSCLSGCHRLCSPLASGCHLRAPYVHEYSCYREALASRIRTLPGAGLFVPSQVLGSLYLYVVCVQLVSVFP